MYLDYYYHHNLGNVSIDETPKKNVRITCYRMDIILPKNLSLNHYELPPKFGQVERNSSKPSLLQIMIF